MPSTTFADLGVPADLVGTLHAHGIVDPFAIQAVTVPDGLAGRDLCGRAPTGSGKTIAFGIPLVARVGKAAPKRPRGLVLVPTRELAAQVCGELEWLGRARKLRVAAVYGGVGFGAQLKALRRGVDVARRLPGSAHRPDRARRGRPRRGRDRRRRRGRPHGRHGLPARGPAAARPHARRPARRCCSRRRSTAPSTASCSATSATPSRHSLPEADQTAPPPTASGPCDRADAGRR